MVNGAVARKLVEINAAADNREAAAIAASTAREQAAKNDMRAITDELEVRLEDFAGQLNDDAVEAARLREEAAVEAERLRQEAEKKSLEGEMLSALQKFFPERNLNRQVYILF